MCEAMGGGLLKINNRISQLADDLRVTVIPG